ncbi:hypothetical protein V8B97DRAFT_2010599 [Scleroderma yunnanense]
MRPHVPSRVSSSHHVPVFDTSTITAALANPYAQSYGMSPHYYQAYMQASHNRPPCVATTAEGYTFSSTYVPRRESFRSQPLPDPSADQAPPSPKSERRIIANPSMHGSWYQPGNFRCQRQGCPFLGSHKSVEIHMMDRHFIFPPGWDKNKDNWDADPSLKGKPIPIQGTSVLLDTPEALDAWIAERRNRFPTTARVQEKKRKMEEAIARGQLTPEDMGLASTKRRKHEHLTDGSASSSRGQRGRSRGVGRGRGTFVRRGEASLVVNDQNSTASRSVSLDGPVQENSVGSDSDSEGQGPPEETSSRSPVHKPPCALAMAHTTERSIPPIKVASRPPLQPRKPPRNSFLSRPTLLQIRVTVSNLSQAIRFLVDNNFLEGVELRPGEAHQQMIEVVGSSDNKAPTSPAEDHHGDSLVA